MKSNYKQLGQFIRQVDVRNAAGKEENLLGVSVQKTFIPSIANTVGTDFTKYKVVRRGQFTYIPDTSRRGDKIGIALLSDYEEGLVSNVYTTFEVIDKNDFCRNTLCSGSVDRSLTGMQGSSLMAASEKLWTGTRCARCSFRFLLLVCSGIL